MNYTHHCFFGLNNLYHFAVFVKIAPVELADGLPNKAIAVDIGITLHTVKFHIASILSKLDAESRTEAVTVGIRLGMILL